jgi:hypothetical protein
MAALVTAIAGRYSSTYNSVDLGVTNDPGYKLSFTPDWELVKDTDAYGTNVIEAILLGLSQVSLDFVTKSITAGPYTAMTPFSTFAPTGAQTFSSGLVGRRATDLALSVVMTATALTPAAVTPATATFLYAMIHEGVNIDMIFGPRHRTIPIKFRIIANGTTTANYFTTT